MTDMWTQDGELIETSQTAGVKLKGLLWISAVVAAALAANQFMFEASGFDPARCAAAAALCAALYLRFSYREQLPLAAGLFAGLLGGAAAYGATNFYVANRSLVFTVEFLIVAAIATIPSLVL
jgi:hypothetical protein